IRYAHKVLAHTLFARRETARVNEDEMSLLIDGIKPMLQKCANGKMIIGRREMISNAFILAKQLLYYKGTWVKSSKPSSQLSIGGIVTPILLFCGVKLGGREEELTRIDAPYLSKADFLEGRFGSNYAYNYHTSLKEQKTLLLPNVDLTALTSRDNVIFQPSEEMLYQARIHPPLEPICGSKKNDREDVGSSRDVLPAPKIIGSERYDFQPYGDAIQNKALRHAYNSINLLQRYVK
ncbi:unnamed protein product, partial [Arabidopsis halleri]